MKTIHWHKLWYKFPVVTQSCSGEQAVSFKKVSLLKLLQLVDRPRNQFWGGPVLEPISGPPWNHGGTRVFFRLVTRLADVDVVHEFLSCWDAASGGWSCRCSRAHVVTCYLINFDCCTLTLTAELAKVFSRDLSMHQNSAGVGCSATCAHSYLQLVHM